MSNTTESSIDWLQNKLVSLFEHDDNGFYKNLFEQAKAMHKEEIKDAYKEGNHSEMRGGKVIFEKMEDYYNETFGGDNE